LLVADTPDLANGNQLAQRLQPDQFVGQLRAPPISDATLPLAW